MKSRTNAQQELMRQQIIEEERNKQFQKLSLAQNVLVASYKVGKSSPRNPNSTTLLTDKGISITKNVLNCELSSKHIITVPKYYSLNPEINKRQRSSSYSVMSDNCQTKLESFSPAIKSPMDLAFSNLGNDDALDWNQIEPSIISTSEISQDLFEQMNRDQQRSIKESYMEAGFDENDSLQDDQSVSSLKPSTSCPANIANPLLCLPGQTLLINQQHKNVQKQAPNVSSGIVEDQKLQWMRDRNKKDCHNRIERKRRDYINNQIQELGQLLPEKLLLSTESKRNKGGILKNSVIYIQQLQQMVSCLQHLQKEAQISENVISLFYKRLQLLESLLSQNGINFDQSANEKGTLQEWFNIHQTNSQLLENVNNIKSSWSADHDGGIIYGDVNVKNEDISAENVLNSSIPIRRVQSSNSGAGGSSSGTQSVTNYSSPINTASINQSDNNNSNRSRTTPVSNINIITMGAQQQCTSQIYGTSQPFSKTGIKLYEQKSSITDSPVLSSILIGSQVSGNIKLGQEHSGNRQQMFSGLSNSVPDGSRTSFLNQSNSMDNSSSERYYLIPISKSKGIQLVTNDIKNNRGIIKVDTNTDDTLLTRIHSSTSETRFPRVALFNSYPLNQDDEVQNFAEISSNHNDNEDSLMGEFEFDDIAME